MVAVCALHLGNVKTRTVDVMDGKPGATKAMLGWKRIVIKLAESVDMGSIIDVKYGISKCVFGFTYPILTGWEGNTRKY